MKIESTYGVLVIVEDREQIKVHGHEFDGRPYRNGVVPELYSKGLTVLTVDDISRGVLTGHIFSFIVNTTRYDLDYLHNLKGTCNLKCRLNRW